LAPNSGMTGEKIILINELSTSSAAPHKNCIIKSSPLDRSHISNVKGSRGRRRVLKLKRGFYMSPFKALFKALGSSLSPLLTLLALWPRKYIHLWPQVSWPKQWNIFSIFLMLHHWLASHEGFSIKCWHVYRTRMHRIKKGSLKNASKLKSESKCGEYFSIFLSNFDNFVPKRGKKKEY